MRVSFTPTARDLWLGGVNYLRNLFAALHTAPAGIEPIVFVADTEAAAVFDASAEVIIAPEVRPLAGAAQTLVALTTGRTRGTERLFERHGVDVSFETTAFFGRSFGIPVLSWIPDLQHRALPHMFRRGRWWRRELMVRARLHAARHVMLSSRSARDDLLRCYDYDSSRVSVVPFAVVPIAADADVDVVAEYDLPPAFFFLPNQFWRHKNHIVVAQAMKRIRDAGREPPVVVLTGTLHDPRDRGAGSELQAAVTEAGLDHHMRVLGVIPYPHVIALLRRCVALINPSLFEGWSTTVEEAKTYGVPMILSDIPVHREQAAGFARFFSPDDAARLAGLLTDAIDASSRRTQTCPAPVSAQAHARVAEYSRAFADAVRKSAET